MASNGKWNGTTGEGSDVIGGRRKKTHWQRGLGLSLGLAGLLAAYAVVDRPAMGEPATDDPAAAAPAAAPALLPAAGDGPIRQTEAEAVAHAVDIGERVEIGAFRGETRETYANPDGTLTSVEHAQPVRVVRDGRWVPVDATLVTAADGSIGPRAAVLGLRLSGGGDTPLVRVERAGRSLTLDWPGTLPAPTIDGDQVTYPEVLPGVDLVVNVAVTGFSHVLVVKTPEAAQQPELAELEFGLDTAGLAVQDSPDGGLAAVDEATGAPVLEAAAPTMWDSGDEGSAPPGRAATDDVTDSDATGADAMDADPAESAPQGASVAPVSWRIDGDALTLLPDQAMLADPETRWPVYIDPIWQDTRNSAWAMVASGYPNQEYWKFSGTEGVGDCPVSSGQCNNVGVKRIYYALPTPYSGRTILSAEFRVTMTHTYNSTAKNVSLYRAGSGISSGTNWNNKPALSVLQQTKAPTAKQSSCTSTNQNVGFTATAAVREAVTRGWSTTTFGLAATNESDQTAFKRFCGNAILSVNYNRTPTQPKRADLTMSPGGVCVTGTNRPYVDTPPTLFMVLRDPDHSSAHTEQVRGEILYYWYDSAGTRVNRYVTTGWKASGSRFQYTLPSNIPQNTPITWEVRAGDSHAWSKWSWEADANANCQFVYDATAPAAPDIDSPEYLPLDAGENTSACVEDDQHRGGVGIYGSFTFDSASTDAVRYLYGFNTNPSTSNELVPTSGGGPVSLRWMPVDDGPNFVTVQAVDQSGLRSAIATCVFSVPTRLAAGEWGLGETAGAASAEDARGNHPATAGASVTFGVAGPGCGDSGPQCQFDRAIRFTGSAADSYLATTSSALVDTSTGFGASAWVRLTDDSTDRVAISQDGSGEPGFTLGFDAATGKWEFAIPSTDVLSLSGWSVTSTAPAVRDEWTHLAAAYDPELKTMTLYVNGDVQPTVQRRSAWKSRGAVQIGRAYARSGHTAGWAGELADIAVFDRVLVPREVSELSTLRPVRLGYWPLDDVSDDRSPAYDENGQEVLLEGGAHLYAPDVDADPFAEPAMVGGGHLVLDGVDDRARTEAPVAVTDGSFTVAARVRLPSPTCGDRDQAVLSQAGVTASGFVIRCGSADRWELVLPHSDTNNPQTTVVFDGEQLPRADQSGQHLAVVYDAFRNEVRLYVDGVATATGTASYSAGWRADGPLQIGRALHDGSFGQYLGGVVDEVRVYTGVADDQTIQRLVLPQPNPNL
ncbi:DNRLRE domain-containing protein [Solwaraspora sp. WMMD406]|uniref:LamG-like jellyroll fold domain-containing protein n=1 Tax=Solwaraspora sp. WMMD406 TaxID=3016095 RepID=UPI002415D5AF|nr:LamG-like jellyroll fold domain-containing protein [Solwaraspora sp. WMMD406]MDG4763439.1 DNRLRE domain-containing protein [Solwaraspora sp. WMMD406]